MPVVFQTHRHILDRLTRIQPDFQLFARIHHLQFQLGLHIIQRAGHPAQIINRRAGWRRSGWIQPA